jgi:hypothetical protein
MIALAQPALARDFSQVIASRLEAFPPSTLRTRGRIIARRTFFACAAKRRSSPAIPMPHPSRAPTRSIRPTMQRSFRCVAGGVRLRGCAARSLGCPAAGERNTALDAAIARHAAANGLPAELVHRVVIRESRYNPRARNRQQLGLMQIKHATARGVGYTGPPPACSMPRPTSPTRCAISRAPIGRPAATRAARSRFMPAAITARHGGAARPREIVADAHRGRAGGAGGDARRRGWCASIGAARGDSPPAQGESILAVEPGALLQFLNHAGTKRAFLPS